MTRLTTALLAVCALLALCGCEQTKGNTPDTKKDTIAPQSSMENAYKGGGRPGQGAGQAPPPGPR